MVAMKYRKTILWTCLLHHPSRIVASRSSFLPLGAIEESLSFRTSEESLGFQTNQHTKLSGASITEPDPDNFPDTEELHLVWRFWETLILATAVLVLLVTVGPRELYAVAKNALWDDPASATAGRAYCAFKDAAAEKNLTEGGAAKYLSWRISYLKCAGFFAIVQMVIVVPFMSRPWTMSSAFFAFCHDRIGLGNLNSPTRYNFYLEFEKHRAWIYDFIPMVLSLAFAFGAVATAQPFNAIQRQKLSRKLNYTAWLIGVFWTYVIMACPWTVPNFVDWRGIRVDHCSMITNLMLNAPFLGLRPALEFAGKNELLNTSKLGFLRMDAPEWCSLDVAKWPERFHVIALHCLREAEDKCLERLCVPLSKDLEFVVLVKCLAACLPILHEITFKETESSPVGIMFTPSVVKLGIRPDDILVEIIGNVKSCQSCQSCTELDQFEFPTLQSVSKFISSLSQQVQTLLADPMADPTLAFAAYKHIRNVGRLIATKFANVVVLTTDVVETIFSVVVVFGGNGQRLLTSLLSLLGGGFEALVNAKAVFPSEQTFPFLMLITSFLAFIVNTSLILCLHQAFGDTTSWLWTMILISYFAIGIVTSLRIMRMWHTDAWREVLYKRMYGDYAMRGLIAIIFLGVLWFWVYDGITFRSFGIVDKEHLFPYFISFLKLNYLVGLFVEYHSKKSLFAIAATDILLEFHVENKQWEQTQTPERAHALKSLIEELDKTLHGLDASEIRIKLASELENSVSTVELANIVGDHTAISACEEAGQWERAGTHEGLEPNVISCNTALSSCEEGGQWERAHTCRGMLPETISSSTAISACEFGGQWDQCLTPEVISSTAISACEAGGELERERTQEGSTSDFIGSNTAISTWNEGSRWERASIHEAVSASMLSSQHAISFNAEVGGQWERARTQEGLAPDVISCNTATSTCKEGGQWERAHTHKEMPPERLSFNTIRRRFDID